MTNEYRVVNLNAFGTGSLRDALESGNDDPPRTVVFDVGGLIRITWDITLHDPYIIIAGETAPSPGITLAGAGLQIRTHDVEMRHIRIRLGDLPDGPDPRWRDCISIAEDGVELFNIVLDHCSLSWASNDIVNTWYANVHDITVRNCIISEGLFDFSQPNAATGCGMLIGDHTQRMLVVRNLFAHNVLRNPCWKGDTTVAVINNVVYNAARWGIFGNDNEGTGPWSASVIGNVVKAGLDDRELGQEIFVKSNTAPGSRLYLNDNIAQYFNDASFDPLVSEPPWLPESLEILPSSEVESWVLANAGARPWDRDVIDQRIVADVRNGTGHVIASQDDVGGWQAIWHGYIGIENLNLNDSQRQMLIAELRRLGPAFDLQPARLNHWRTRLDGEAVIFEALFNENNLTAARFKQWLGDIFGIDSSTINHQTQQTQHGPVVTFSRGGTDYLRFLLFGGQGSAWSESGDQARAFLVANQSKWDPPED